MKTIIVMVVGIALSIASMGTLHFWQLRGQSESVAQVSVMGERKAISQDLQLALERYRRLSGSFRRTGDAGVASAKNDLREDVRAANARLAELAPTKDEEELATSLAQQLSDFMLVSAKLEPMLFSRDVFQKAEAQQSFDNMQKTVKQLRAQAEARQADLSKGQKSSDTGWYRALGALALAAAAMLLAIVGSVFWSYVRPLRRLSARASEVLDGKLGRSGGSRLRGLHLGVEKALDSLATVVEAQQREKQNFVTAIATDMRGPLVPLQVSANLLAGAADKLDASQREEACDIIRRSVFRVSRVLDDLGDTLALDRGSIRLVEKIVDLRDLVSHVCLSMSGPGATHKLRAYVPSMPVLGFVDPQRLERVLINLVSKLAQYSPQGGAIDVTLFRKVRNGTANDVEIVIHEAGGGAASSGERSGSTIRTSGPEQDLVRHWISENGFGMALAQKIVEAHGGTVTAAGVAGTQVVFSLRIPEERIAGRGSADRPGIKTQIASGSVKTQQPKLTRDL